MSGLPRHILTGEPMARGGHLTAIGPDTDPVRLFEVYERRGHADPAKAWDSFTAAWNWSAPLPSAVPAGSGAGAPVARQVPGGFLLSGRYHVPPGTGCGRWLALPLACPAREPDRPSAAGRPDVFVVASKALPRSPASPGDALRLDGLYVPAGFATCGSGTPLRDEDAAFLWTAVTATALGAARRLTDCLAALDEGRALPGGAGPVAAVSPAAAAAELASVLLQEREVFTSRPRHAPNLAPGCPFPGGEDLAARVRRACGVVHHVVAVAYEHAMPFRRSDDRHPLESPVADSSPLLQHARYTADLLPTGDTTSPAGR